MKSLCEALLAHVHKFAAHQQGSQKPAQFRTPTLASAVDVHPGEKDLIGNGHTTQAVQTGWYLTASNGQAHLQVLKGRCDRNTRGNCMIAPGERSFNSAKSSISEFFPSCRNTPAEY